MGRQRVGTLFPRDLEKTVECEPKRSQLRHSVGAGLVLGPLAQLSVRVPIESGPKSAHQADCEFRGVALAVAVPAKLSIQDATHAHQAFVATAAGCRKERAAPRTDGMKREDDFG